MKFDSEHKVFIDSLKVWEAPFFKLFLLEEKARHIKEKEYADFMFNVRTVISPIYASAALRHEEDIKAIDALILDVEEMFGL